MTTATPVASPEKKKLRVNDDPAMDVDQQYDIQHIRNTPTPCTRTQPGKNAPNEQDVSDTMSAVPVESTGSSESIDQKDQHCTCTVHDTLFLFS